MIMVHETLQELARSIIPGLGSSWLLDCDTMHDSYGAPQILEINPRSLVAGVIVKEPPKSLAHRDSCLRPVKTARKPHHHFTGPGRMSSRGEGWVRNG